MRALGDAKGATAWVAATLLLAVAAGCGGSRTTYDGFFVEVSAPRGLAVEQFAVWVIATVEGERRVAPRDPEQADRYRFETKGRDLAGSPYLARLVPGERIRGMARIVVLGYVGTRVTSRGTAEGDLDGRQALRLVLEAVPDGCDVDGDGFPDCARNGCCATNEPLSDCNDNESRATPVGFEDACTRCGFGPDLDGDSVDDDCDQTPATCLDKDGDRSRDCVPAWCDMESKGSPACGVAAGDVDCDPLDPTAYPGALELCDSRDNNCDGSTDETVTLLDWDGVTMRRVGDACGTGICEGGTVECDGSTRQPRCSTDPLKAAKEDCDGDEDENCNGAVNDPAKDGCSLGDLDGDGVSDAEEDRLCPRNPWAKYHAEVFPDSPNGPHHPRGEACCLGLAAGAYDAECDWNCDSVATPCAADDADGDGFPVGADCVVSDPMSHPGAHDRCDDDIDQDCKGGDTVCDLIADPDRDGFPVADGDCDGSDAAVNPWAPERCNGRDDNCDGYTDEGNPEAQDAPCGSDVGECAKGTSVCVHEEGKPAAVTCIGDRRPSGEVCDGLDNDCDGKTDEAYAYDPATGGSCGDPEDQGTCGSLPRVGQGCLGIGACGEPTVPCPDRKEDDPPRPFACEPAGIVVCVDASRATCSTNPDGPNPRASAESCNARDDDCDGQTDEDLTSVEDSTCRTFGVCLENPTYIGARCTMGTWACDYGRVPGFEEGVETSCDGLDNNCDSAIDEPFRFSDDVNPTPVKKGEGCGTGACANGTTVCRADGTGLECDTTLLQAGESCDGLDNDCDGQTDEDFRFEGLPVWIDASDTLKGHPECTGIGRCARSKGHVECYSRTEPGCSTNPMGSQHLDLPETCNALDDDCNGRTDEGLTSVADSDCRKTGVCATGIAQMRAECSMGDWLCTYDAIPFWQAGVESACDGKDNDCDGETDEDFAFADWNGTVTVKGDRCGIGTCRDGQVRCKGDLTGLECSTGSIAHAETCDGLDDDCDGDTDEGFAYGGAAPGEPCTGVGRCGEEPGLVECHPTHTVAVCSTNSDGSASRAVDETCNEKDDDCNGRTDDGMDILDSTCRRVGVCDPALVDATCLGGAWICAFERVPGYQSPSEQSCDGKDNDCDGQTDEDFSLADWDLHMRTKGQSCGTGACANGSMRCRTDGAGLECSTSSGATTETCDGEDDDCDGATDDGTDAGCADVLICTQDACSAGTCIHPVIRGWCLVGGACYADQAPHPTNPCLWCDSTKSVSGWSNRSNGTSCDADGSGCTQNDSCQAGSCTAGAPPSCTYLDEPCKRGVCVSTGVNSHACNAVSSGEGGACDDQVACTHADKCVGGICKGTSYSCNDSLGCTSDSCDGKGACAHEITDGCLIAGICVQAGVDHPTNPCQRCMPASSRTSWSDRPDDDPCDDGNPCDIGDRCKSGVCAPGVPFNCSDGDPCTRDLCDPEGPAADPCDNPVDVGATCNDLKDQTYTDVCGANGLCAGTPYECTPKDSCYTVTYLGLPPPTGCSQVLLPDFCYVSEVCWVAGSLDPTNQCRSCQPLMRTESFYNRQGSCSDGSQCTVGDVCAGGGCVPGPRKICAEPNPTCREPEADCACGTNHSVVCDAAVSDNCAVDANSDGACMCGAEAGCDPALKKCCPATQTTPARCCGLLSECGVTCL